MEGTLDINLELAVDVLLCVVVKSGYTTYKP